MARPGKQRYRCRKPRCAGRTFLLDYARRVQSPEVKRLIIDTALNASRIHVQRWCCMPARTPSSKNETKEPELQQIDQAVLVSLNPEQVEVEMGRAEELAQHCRLRSELDAMGAYMAKKVNLRWL